MKKLNKNLCKTSNEKCLYGFEMDDYRRMSAAEDARDPSRYYVSCSDKKAQECAKGLYGPFYY